MSKHEIYNVGPRLLLFTVLLLSYMGPTCRSYNVVPAFKNQNIKPISIGFITWAHLYRNYDVGQLFINVNMGSTFRNQNMGSHSQDLQCGSTFCKQDHMTHIYELQSQAIFFVIVDIGPTFRNQNVVPTFKNQNMGGAHL